MKLVLQMVKLANQNGYILRLPKMNWIARPVNVSLSLVNTLLLLTLL